MNALGGIRTSSQSGKVFEPSPLGFIDENSIQRTRTLSVQAIPRSLFLREDRLVSDELNAERFLKSNGDRIFKSVCDKSGQIGIG